MKKAFLSVCGAIVAFFAFIETVGFMVKDQCEKAVEEMYEELD